MKKWLFCILGILCAAAVIVGYHFSYPIRADQSNLEQSIDQWFNRGNQVEISYQLQTYPPLALGKLTYLPIELNEELGYVLLEESITGRYKITLSSHGTVTFRNGIIDVGGEKFLLFMGRNTLGQISKVKFTVDINHEYEIVVPTQAVFLVCTPADRDSPIGPISLERMTLYDAEGQDITSKFDLSGGSIQ